jgi:protein SCO1
MARKRSIARVALAAVFLVASIFIPSHAAQAENHWGADYFPNVPLTTQDGKVVHFYDDLLKDKIVAIDLIYTHCHDACPLETARLAQVQKMLGDRVGKDIFFYSISIDPDRDTPAEMKAYAEKFHAGPGWLFLSGKQQDIELIAKKLGLYSPNWGRDGHAPDLMIGDVPAGQWMRNAATDNPRFLAIMIGNFLSNWKHQEPGTTKDYAEARPLHLDKGQYIFATQCAACHSIGHGDKIGPDLLGVTNVRDRAWLTRFIATPDKVLNEKDPIATLLYDKYKQVNMPNLRLGSEDVAVLISFLEAQTKAHAVPDKDLGDMKMDHSGMQMGHTAMNMDHSAMKMEADKTKQTGLTSPK